MTEIGKRPVMTDPPAVLVMVLPCFRARKVSARRVSWKALAVVSAHDVLCWEKNFVNESMAFVWLVFSK